METDFNNYTIKLSFTKDFVQEMKRLYEKYGEEIFSIQGISNSQLDIANFSKKFFTNSASASSVSDVSVDANANVKEKTVTQYQAENSKSQMRLNSLYMMYKTIKKMYSKEEASKALEKVISGEIFVNDLHSYSSSPYCYAFSISMLLTNGMDFFKGTMKIKPPHSSATFIQLFQQTVAYISNQIVGAAAFPDFFLLLNYFYEKEFGSDYIQDLKKDKEVKGKTWYFVKNQFQNIIYSLNFPWRSSGQSSFTNFTIMDKPYLQNIFKNFVFPDSTIPNFDNVCELSKLFFEYFTEINCNEGMFTFPVTTLASSLDDNGEYLDKDFAKWSAKANYEKSLGNIFQDVPTALSSCCRLRNDLTKLSSNGFSNSFGVGGTQIGSLRVTGLNLPRLAYLEKDNPNILEEDLEVCHKILLAHRKIIRRKIKDGYLPLYTTGWMSLSKQYSTIGTIGAYEYLCNKGLDITKEDGLQDILSLYAKIESIAEKWQEAEKVEKNTYNSEAIPGEAMSVREAEIDFLLGYNNKSATEKNYELYSNQYLPLIKEASVYDRLRIQGQLDFHTSGGSIAHINLSDDKFSEANMFKLMDDARKLKVKYFAVNRAYSECQDSHYIIGKKETCPICNKPITQYYTRTVGFITAVKNWIPVRRDYEFPKRKFYKVEDFED